MQGEVGDIGRSRPPPDFSITGRNPIAEAVTSRPYYVKMWYLTDRPSSSSCCNQKVDETINVSEREVQRIKRRVNNRTAAGERLSHQTNVLP
ncbi:hypothetical protein EVAR_55859_1 [Eumeta japonica]|uniref:Uncharacterized protein n=1 Tax=Eumeta variegata TaxID=151549 RepID=A0A4C1Z154_EUMVA|nr:hypothetical protein EVAR_55859_1 [Eumeta japonica]